jgi:hypothetical protein
MHWLISNTNLEDYKDLCEADGIVPVIFEQKEDMSLVDMTVTMSAVWAMCGYWYEFG